MTTLGAFIIILIGIFQSLTSNWNSIINDWNFIEFIEGSIFLSIGIMLLMINRNRLKKIKGYKLVFGEDSIQVHEKNQMIEFPFENLFVDVSPKSVLISVPGKEKTIEMNLFSNLKDRLEIIGLFKSLQERNVA